MQIGLPSDEPRLNLCMRQRAEPSNGLNMDVALVTAVFLSLMV